MDVLVVTFSCSNSHTEQYMLLRLYQMWWSQVEGCGLSPTPSQTDWPASMTLHLITQRESIIHIFWQLSGDKSSERWPEQGVENNAPDYQIGFHWTLNISCSTSNRGHADGLNKWQTYMSITRRLPPHPLGQAPGIMSGSYFQSHQPCVSRRPPNTETTL